MAAKKPQPPPITIVRDGATRPLKGAWPEAKPLDQKIWSVTYDGSWSGGTAIVVASTPEQATELVMNDKETINFRRPNVTLLSDNIKTPKVLYNDNGAY